MAPTVILLLFAIIASDFGHLRAAHALFPHVFTPRLVFVLKQISWGWHLAGLTALTGWLAFFGAGFAPSTQLRRYQNDLDTIGLTNAQGSLPKIVAVFSTDESRTRLLVTAKGIGVDRFEGKKGDLESAFGQMVERIATTKDRKYIELLLCRKALTQMLPYQEAATHLKNPYSFVVGESIDGILVQDICELPHMLIAGSTGGGKSVFFRQALVGLLESSRHLQMYLIDLKRGVEVKEFESLPNVKIAKTEGEAVQILEAVKDEMQRRFVMMEERKIKKIIPDAHKIDLIVVGIDEASVLYGKTTIRGKAELVAKARELTDELTKLGRAAGIHLILATQKPIKESLDTKSLENLGGRMVFKMSTHAGSNTALGNVRAYSLPDIKGRAIWAGGNKFIEIQAPYLSESDFGAKCAAMTEELLRHKDHNFQKMLLSERAADAGTARLNQMATHEEAA